ncbi:ATP-binding protein [Prevotella copri]|uniref:ATP-binding protein n=1 Tax=Segatella copri TaxID=165179 RepID=A0AA90UFA9_9BACT|nr:ATP-binding protein [Segatella copri]MQN12172.1 ATP-binding protein [Segatella copri]MQO10412.1 ATP-binding protein [Segatella copri]
MENSLQFKISSALKDLVGKDLITSDNVAIFELVKNSYDAYANHVVITFSKNKITIADNGKGMSLSDLKDKWLFLGFSAKKDGTEDEVNDKQKSYRDKIRRFYAGAKGIGRFSCDRLGRLLTITTKTRDSLLAEQILVDWANFEVDQKIEFDNVDVEHRTLNVGNVFPNQESHGTIIEIEELHDEETPWTRKHILELKRSLQKLINPYSETNDFVIEIICERERKMDFQKLQDGVGFDRDIVNGPLKNSITEILKLKTTQIDVKISDGFVYTTLTDRGVDIYRIREHNIHFPLIKNATVSLSFLNRAAKYNFTRLMGIDSINFGSVFLFRNGFRILPFGETGDDSWGIDFRAQQGRARYLGSRDLMGRVDVTVEDVNELKEASSRDSGLIDTPMSRQVKDLYKLCHKRLERYVVGVLWGESFLRNEYFKNDDVAWNARKELQKVDKDSEDPSFILHSSFGSKIDFVRLVKTLTSDNNVEVLAYNSDLANFVTSSLEPQDIKLQFISDLETIARRTGNQSLENSVEEAKRKIEEISRQKEEAERKAAEAESRQREAEEKALKAEETRREAEARAKSEEEKRRSAELARLRAENEKIKADNARLIAEKKTKEETTKRKQVEKEKQLETLKVEFYKKASTPDTDALIHHVKNNNSRINDKVDELIRYVVDAKDFDKKEEVLVSLSIIKKLSQKTLAATDLILNCDLAKSDSQKINLPLFLKGYLAEEVKTSLNCHFSTDVDLFAIYGSKLDLALLIDNFVKNSEDWHASNIWFSCVRHDKDLELDVYDDGEGLIDSFRQDPNQIFEFAKSGKPTGSGFGMYLIKETLNSLHATIEIATPINGVGIHFKMFFK